MPMEISHAVQHPGSLIPARGTYRCSEGHDEHTYEATDADGQEFPPLPEGCEGAGWVLEDAEPLR